LSEQAFSFWCPGHYHFLNRETFEQKVTNGEFLEYAEVHGNFYGTLKIEVLNHLAAGTDVVMDIDVQGADQVRGCDDASIQAALVDLFVMPQTEGELLKRLTGRGSDAQEVIELRMKNALGEIGNWPKYTYRLLSDTREQDYHQFKSLMLAERLKVSRLKNLQPPLDS
jgi:guanylate kinase